MPCFLVKHAQVREFYWIEHLLVPRERIFPCEEHCVHFLVFSNAPENKINKQITSTMDSRCSSRLNSTLCIEGKISVHPLYKRYFVCVCVYVESVYVLVCVRVCERRLCDCVYVVYVLLQYL